MHLTSEASILKAIRRVSDGSRCLIIHSSFAHFRLPSSFEKWDFLSVIQDLIDEGVTIAVPAFTFSFCNSGRYDAGQPSEVGILGDWVASLREFKRTENPIYSHWVGGPLSNLLMESDSTDAFGNNSIFSKFEELDSKIIMFGCGWQFCTQFHRCEQKFEVPYRFFKEFSGVVNYNADNNTQVKMFVRDLDINPDNNFDLVISELEANNKIEKAELWGAKIESVSISEINRVVGDLLSKDPFSLVTNSSEIAYQVSLKRLKKENLVFRVAIFGKANLSIFRNLFEEVLSSFIVDRKVECFTPEFGQDSTVIFDSESIIYQEPPLISFFLDRLEDLLDVMRLGPIDLEIAQEAVELYVHKILEFRGKNTGILFVGFFPFLSQTELGFGENSTDSGTKAILAELNRILEEKLATQPDLYLVDLERLALIFRGDSILDYRLWSIGRFPYSEPFSNFLVKRFSGLVLAATHRTVRLIVLDLDNTLWGGVLGEDGEQNLAIGGDFPGNLFRDFQKLLKNYSDRGIALAICSKNDESLALAAIENIEAMILKTSDFVSHRINWDYKWKNIQEICEELNLGLGSVLFVDDNPVERELVRKYLPEVRILNLPQDPAEYANALLNCPWLESLGLTEEDTKRAKSYRARSNLRDFGRQFSTLMDFFKSLNLKVYIQNISESNVSRALQLVNKTNQFNTTTRRHTASDIELMIKDDWQIFVIGADDRFSERENMGLIILRQNYPEAKDAWIDTYLLSCRVLGKGIEEGVLLWLTKWLTDKGFERLFGEIIFTDKNTPVRDIYEKSGFRVYEERWKDTSRANSSGSLWIRDLEKSARLPEWIEFIIEGKD